MELGRRLLERELKKFKKSLKKLEHQGTLERELSHWGFSRPEDLYAAVGYGKIPPRNALERFVSARGAGARGRRRQARERRLARRPQDPARSARRTSSSWGTTT